MSGPVKIAGRLSANIQEQVLAYVPDSELWVLTFLQLNLSAPAGAPPPVGMLGWRPVSPVTHTDGSIGLGDYGLFVRFGVPNTPAIPASASKVLPVAGQQNNNWTFTNAIASTAPFNSSDFLGVAIGPSCQIAYLTSVGSPWSGEFRLYGVTCP